MEQPHVIVVGGGAAGMLAAVTAASFGVPVTLVERNPKMGRKLYITGKGRCNVTNNCPVEEVLSSIPRNSRFLNSALRRFPPQAAMEWFVRAGVPLKTERGNRVFPVSDRAADVIDALVRQLRRLKVQVIQGRAVEVLARDGRACGVALEDGRAISGDRVILATGGVSYPLPGSTGDGYAMAAAHGHTIVPPRPSLVPLVAKGDLYGRMQGLSLKNVSVKVKNAKGKVIFEDFGEMLFTHFGLSGPLILSASAHMSDYEANRYTVLIDLKPALDEKKLDARILRDLEEQSNRDVQNMLGGLVNRLMVPVMLELTGIPGETKCHSVTREQRRRLLEQLKALRIEIEGPRPVEEAVVTAGGVKVSEVDPHTMQSRRLAGLYFAGELLDVDGYTAGINLQIAWATGHAAGEAAAQAANQDTGCETQ